MSSVAPKPIETRAFGCRFRSRLEARYAVFMTALGVKWSYEPEGFQLKSGLYLPDFFLPELKAWLEIKPHGIGSYFGFCADSKNCMPSLNDQRLDEFADFAESRGEFFVIAYGLPSNAFLFEKNCPDYSDEGMLEAPWDPMMWCMCGCGTTAGIAFDGRGDRVECSKAGCHKSGHGDKGYSYNHPRIVDAVAAARSARFEHGETFL